MCPPIKIYPKKYTVAHAHIHTCMHALKHAHSNCPKKMENYGKIFLGGNDSAGKDSEETAFRSYWFS